MPKQSKRVLVERELLEKLRDAANDAYGESYGNQAKYYLEIVKQTDKLLGRKDVNYN